MNPNITNGQSTMKVYICVTLYHVYVTLVKVFSEQEDISKIVIFLNANNEKVYQQYIYIGQQLQKHGFVCDVRLRKKWDELRGKVRVQNKHQFLIVEEQMRKIGVSEFTLYNFAWNNSYVYSTANLLYKKSSEAFFIEESAMIAKLPVESNWKKALHKLLGGGVDFIKDDKLKAIYVQNPAIFPEEWQSKLLRFNLSDMIEKLKDENKKDILTIMSQYGESIANLLKDPNIGIVFTSPFSEQNLITEQEKIKYTLEMCDYYKRYGRLVLKLHPRDTTMYPVSEDVAVLPTSFPSELLSLTGCKFKFAIAICSGAVETANAQYKINMNENFLQDKLFKLRDIHGEVIKE